MFSDLPFTAGVFSPQKKHPAGLHCLQPTHHNKKTSRSGTARDCFIPPGSFDLLALMRKSATLIIGGKEKVSHHSDKSLMHLHGRMGRLRSQIAPLTISFCSLWYEMPVQFRGPSCCDHYLWRLGFRPGSALSGTQGGKNHFQSECFAAVTLFLLKLQKQGSLKRQTSV